MSNEVKINGAIHHIIEYMQEDNIKEIGYPIKHKGIEYYVSIDEVKEWEY